MKNRKTKKVKISEVKNDGNKTNTRPPLKKNRSFSDMLNDSVFQSSVRNGRLQKTTRRRVFFILGGLVGFLIAFYLVLQHTKPDTFQEIPLWIQKFQLEMTTNVDSLVRQYMPEGFTEQSDIFGTMADRLFPPSEQVSNEELQPGFDLRAKNITNKHPVIIIPGVISSGLESWGLGEESKKYFRKRMWGTMNMFQSILMDKQSWMKHIMLDPETGLDPPNVKLRAAQGLDAADYFVTGYWIWAKIIENLAAVGYDNNNLHLAAYDWRLAYPDLEKRDKYFTKLKATIEITVKAEGEKAVILCHSMGGSVLLYFLHWVESDLGGKGGKQWVEEYIDSVVNIAGTMLGAVKSIPSILSGEQRETVQPMAQFLLDRFLTQQDRIDIFRNWGGIASMIPKGGNAVWGDSNKAPDDSDASNFEGTYGNFIQFLAKDGLTHSTTRLRGDEIQHDIPKHKSFNNLTLEDTIELMFEETGKKYANKIKSIYSYGLAKSESEMQPNSPATWSNPLESQLPNAPSLKIYCVYGYGLSTERNYFYTPNPTSPNQPVFSIDSSVNLPNYETLSGVRQGLGDGSVPLISLGYMCAEGWKNKLYNPNGVKVITREFKDQSSPIYEDIRGGRNTSEHINILGNHQVTHDILRIATGFETDKIQDQITSNIKEIAKKINLALIK